MGRLSANGIAMHRRHELDWVRIFAFLLLVLYHVGMYYVSWDWHVKSPHASETLEPLMLASSPWRLSLLFFISGVACSHLLHKRPDGFVGERSRRLLIPLLFGMLVIVPPQAYFEVVEKLPGGYHDGYLAFWGRYLRADDSFCRAGDCLDLPTWNHLWFVAYLWVYCLLLGLGARWLGPGIRRSLFDGFASALSGWRLLWVPIVALGLARIGLLDRFESTHALVDDWYNHAQYALVFAFGVVLAHRGAAWTLLARNRWLSLILAVVAYAATVSYFASFADVEPPQALRMAMRMVWASFQWLAIAAIVGFALAFAPGDSRARRYLTEAVFPVYILHQSLIVVFSQWVKPLGLMPLTEGPLLVLATLAASFGAFELIRRIGWMRPLFGLRLPSARVPALSTQCAG